MRTAVTVAVASLLYGGTAYLAGLVGGDAMGTGVIIGEVVGSMCILFQMVLLLRDKP